MKEMRKKKKNLKFGKIEQKMSKRRTLEEHEEKRGCKDEKEY